MHSLLQLRPALIWLGALLLTGCASIAPQQPAANPATSETSALHTPAHANAAIPALHDPLPTAPLPVQAMPEKHAPPLLDLTVPPDQLWQRIRNGFGMADLHGPLVVDRQSWYLNRPDGLRRIFERGGRYLHHIVEELEKRGMPTELALLPMVESAYNPQAVSPARAMGMWQFIPSTGKNYDLAQNWWVDERRDIIASTDAALTYLKNIYEMHGDWHLALASYNWGEHAVARAIAKNQAKDLPTDYASLTMPAETRYYVPKLQALKNIVAHPEFFDFSLPPLSNQPYFEAVTKPERMDVSIAAQLAGITIEEFVLLNPAYHRPVMNADQAGPLLIPTDKVDTFLANLAQHAAENKPLSNWQSYRMAKGDTLAKIAARYKLSEGRLRQINGITPRLKIKPGFNLLVPRPGSLTNPDAIAHALPRPGPEKATAKMKSSVKSKATNKKPKAKKKPVAKAKKKPVPKKKPRNQ
ncbi:MAG: transglycosylase SLT domain-containing protein [Rhodocyclaceae bacterium]|nr:transglycosylase SLT domain-containing protein [Rhodocyclaceae bacterium]MDZ4214088.1 transglycosylase SLT domain-containing protein [Rhodocyclaceae bacterium]